MTKVLENEEFNSIHIDEGGVFNSLPPFLSTGGMILPKHVTKLTYRIRPHFPKMAIPPTILELLA